jgi:hypothetical protein
MYTCMYVYLYACLYTCMYVYLPVMLKGEVHVSYQQKKDERAHKRGNVYQGKQQTVGKRVYSFYFYCLDFES